MKNDFCGCEVGENCTKTTMCAVQSAVEDKDARIEELEAQLADLEQRHNDAVDAWNREIDRNKDQT